MKSGYLIAAAAGALITGCGGDTSTTVSTGPDPADAQAVAMVLDSPNPNLAGAREQFTLTPHVKGRKACVDIRRKHVDYDDISPEWMHINVDLDTGVEDEILDTGLCNGDDITLDTEDAFNAWLSETDGDADRATAAAEVVRWRINSRSVCLRKVGREDQPGDLARTDETGSTLDVEGTVLVIPESSTCAKAPDGLRPIG